MPKGSIEERAACAQRVKITFECSPEDRMLDVPGDFAWAQIRFNVLRVSREESDNGEIELAHMDSDGRWLYDGNWYTDIVIAPASASSRS